MDTPLGEGGLGLSGGQSRRLALARLLLRDVPLWLLDEPTAAMDDMTERKCINALKAVIRPEHTVVLVTHKPALLELVNRIVVVNSLGQGIVRDCHISELLKPSTTINSATPVSTAL